MQEISRRSRHVQMNAIFAPSETLVITFAPRATLPGAIWGLAPLRKLGHSIVCFVDFADTWFPEDDIRELKGFIQPQLQGYKRVVTYGHSMGGYGALKYGRLFAAERSVALGPAWSVAPQDVQSFDERRPRLYYRPDLHDHMAIKAEDVAPDAIVVYDPGHQEDTLHYRAIAKSVPSVRRVLNYFVDHTLLAPCIDCGAASLFAREVAGGSGTAGLRTLIRKSRGASPRYVSRALAHMENVGRAKAARMIAEKYALPLMTHTAVRTELERQGYSLPDLPPQSWIEVFRKGTTEEALTAAQNRPFSDFATASDMRRWLEIHAGAVEYKHISNFIEYIIDSKRLNDRLKLHCVHTLLSTNNGNHETNCTLSKIIMDSIDTKASYYFEFMRIYIDLALNNTTFISRKLFISKYFTSAEHMTLPDFEGEFLRSFAIRLPPGLYRLTQAITAESDAEKHINADVINKSGRSIRLPILRTMRPLLMVKSALRHIMGNKNYIVINVPDLNPSAETRVNIIMKSNGRQDGKTIGFHGVRIERM